MNNPRALSQPSPSPSDFPDELIGEILSCLPVKPLMRLRSVCKSWNSLISNPNFVQLHLRKSVRKPHLIIIAEQFHSDFYDYRDLELSAMPFPTRHLLENPSLTITIDPHPSYGLTDKDCYYVVGSCNGLICLMGSHSKTEVNEYWFRLWNPATRFCSEKFARICVARSYHSWYSYFAFGYDNLTDTYKVVRFSMEAEASQNSKVAVYRFGDNCWRDLLSLPVVHICADEIGVNEGVYLNGTLNWLALLNSRSDYDWKAVNVYQLVIVSLDLGKETYKQLLPPRGFDEVPFVEPNVGVLMDCLCFSHDYKMTNIVIWQMKEFGVVESWTQFIKVSYQDLQVDLADEDHFHLLPLCASENGDLLIMMKYGSMHAFLYDRRDNRVKPTKINDCVMGYLAKDYVESLVSPY